MKNLLLLLLPIISFAQDELPDYRNKKDNFSKVREKDIRADLASFAIAGVEERIGKKPLKDIPARSFTGNNLVFQEGDTKIIVTATEFEPSKHRLDSVEKYLVKIDKKPYFGNYGSVPKYAISSVTLIFGKDSVAVPQTALFDLYSPTFAHRNDQGSTKTFNAVYLSEDKRTIYVYMMNKENQGNYEVTWVFRDKQYLRRVVDSNILK
ncbi:MAG: hypothetical protein EOO02_02445 [Chitinophagaceae bacterium]|nr:MAG: hypothetical protein EOO02_02445 [Chitinophagaceae bacterium]